MVLIFLFAFAGTGTFLLVRGWRSSVAMPTMAWNTGDQTHRWAVHSIHLLTNPSLSSCYCHLIYPWFLCRVLKTQGGFYLSGSASSIGTSQLACSSESPKGSMNVRQVLRGGMSWKLSWAPTTATTGSRSGEESLYIESVSPSVLALSVVTSRSTGNFVSCPQLIQWTLSVPSA